MDPPKVSRAQLLARFRPVDLFGDGAVDRPAEDEEDEATEEDEADPERKAAE